MFIAEFLKYYFLNGTQIIVSMSNKYDVDRQPSIAHFTIHISL